MAGSLMIIDDHVLLAQAIAASLQVEDVDVRVADLAGPDEILAQVSECAPDVVLLDLDLGAAAGAGEALLPEVLRRGPRVVVVSGSSDVVRLGTCLELGAAGVLSKSRPFEDLLAAVGAALSRRPVMGEQERHALLSRLRRQRAEDTARLEPFNRLTPREAEVLALVMEGHSAAAIAQRAYVSEATIRTQIRAVLSKLCVTSQLAAVAEAHRVGWEGPGAERR